MADKAVSESKMADSVTLAPLKASRADAKRVFQRQANNALGMLAVMSEEELKHAFRSLTIEFNRVLEANEDLEEQLRLESELEGGELSEEQRKDLEKVSSECEEKLSQLKERIVQTLWEKFGNEELSLAVEAAEAEVQRAEAIQENEDREVFEFRVDHLGELVRRTKELHTRWRSWAPPEDQLKLQGRVRELERALMNLTARRAEFIRVRGKNNPARSSSRGRKAATITTAAGQKSAPSTTTAASSNTTGPRSSSAHREAPSSSSSSAPGHRTVRVSLPDHDSGDTHDSTSEHTEKAQTNAAVEMVEQLLKESDFSSAQEGPDSAPPPCIVCGHSKHGLRLYFCRKFQALRLKEKEEAARRLGACWRCLEIHQEALCCDKTEFLCQREECGSEQHHYSLCPKKERPRTITAIKTNTQERPRINAVKTKANAVKTTVSPAQGGGVRPQGGGARLQVYSRVTAVGGARPQSYSRAQQEFVKKLPPELAKEFKQVFRSSAPRSVNNLSVNNHPAAHAVNSHSTNSHSTNSHSGPRSAPLSGANPPSDRAFRAFRGWTRSPF